MYDMIGHIFGGLDMHERRITELEQRVSKRPHGNPVAGILGAVVVLGAGAIIYGLNRQVEQLTREVREQRDILDKVLVPCEETDDTNQTSEDA